MVSFFLVRSFPTACRTRGRSRSQAYASTGPAPGRAPDRDRRHGAAWMPQSRSTGEIDTSSGFGVPTSIVIGRTGELTAVIPRPKRRGDSAHRARHRDLGGGAASYAACVEVEHGNGIVDSTDTVGTSVKLASPQGGARPGNPSAGSADRPLDRTASATTRPAFDGEDESIRTVPSAGAKFD